MNHLEISKAGLNWDVHEPFVRTITVIDEHQDEFGHTNNVSYLSMLQDVAWMHSQKLGLGMADYQRLGAGCVVRRHELNYLAPTHLGDRLAVATWVDENDFRLCMWRGYQIIREQDQAGFQSVLGFDQPTDGGALPPQRPVGRQGEIGIRRGGHLLGALGDLTGQ